MHTVSPKNIPDIFDCNFKKNYQILSLIISGVNISDTTCHQMTIHFPTSPNVWFCTTKGMQTKRNMRWCVEKREKNIPDIIDHNLKKHYQILIIFHRNISDITGYWPTV